MTALNTIVTLVKARCRPMILEMEKCALRGPKNLDGSRHLKKYCSRLYPKSRSHQPRRREARTMARSRKTSFNRRGFLKGAAAGAAAGATALVSGLPVSEAA